MSDLVEKAVSMPCHAFDKYIIDIRFPHFKKLSPNSVITFTSPLTVLVGPNGSGKSSSLQALYGAPMRKSVGDFWFSTDLDPIVESGDDINRFIYRYKVRGIRETIEVLKTRARRKARADTPENPDYWEPAKPNVKDNMAEVPTYSEKFKDVMTLGGRWSPVDKEVVYIDFRSELSAFDKFFYFGQFNRSKTIHKKQDFLRKFSKILSSHLAQPKSKFPISWGRRRKSKSLYELGEDELKWVNQILGKSYVNAKIIYHNLFNNDGYSIIFTEDSHAYSEAVAGSGEVSVVNCVVRVLNAKENSLILLDEPEVSLHPGAQRKLRDLLCHAIIHKKCQVVMSTHSEHFVQGLPNNAIKLFQYQESTSSYHIFNECSPEQAFVRLGVDSHLGKKKVFVEDELAQHLVLEAIKEIDEESVNNFEVIPYPGGATSIIQNLLNHFVASQTYASDVVLLDGDMRKSVENSEASAFQAHLSSGKLCIKQRSEEIPKSQHAQLDEILVKQIGNKCKLESLTVNGGNQDNTDEKIQFKLRMLDIYHDKFHFMNTDTPEELIWEIAKGDELFNIEAIKSRFSSGKFKDRFKAFTSHQNNGDSNSQTILNSQLVFLYKRDKEHRLWIEFKETISKILDLQELN
ncbi:AAA family ATPase [Vibrio harveyi]|uniref:ATP-dependent nuclease n=1 Tax=Vibrio harveyi TaxID=669 RepID=UPI001EFEEE08|nr:ATP-binding protein [Vibrio harveyi]EKO3797959.1 AAA family ATPase [Vibrio harveyi]ELV8772647.1 AAA family ATPase [Vibrio harveyi]MCG9549001.1 AAA family ATPase [Vibrio harveyi]